MKKILLLILTLLLILLFAVGCSNGKTNETNDINQQQEVLINLPQIPEASVYIAIDGTVLRSGEDFPETPSEGDILQCNGYRYGYKKIFNTEKNVWIPIEEDAWTVHVLDKETTSFDECFKKINGKIVIVP